MEKKYVLSIVITTHNDEKYIERCLNSLLNSTKPIQDKVEIVVSVNNSNDKTLELVNPFAKKFQNFKIVSSEKSGPSVARNFGINEASGEYITFVDGDDFIDEDIQKVVEIIENNSEVDYFQNTYYVNKNDLVFCPKISQKKFLNKELDIRQFSKGFTLNAAFSSSSSRIIKTKIIKENNLRYDEDYFQMEDMLFGIHILPFLKTLMFISQPYYHYEVGHENSLTRTISKKRMLQGFLATQKSNDFIKRKIKDKIVAKKFLQFSSLMSYSLIRRVKFLNKKEQFEVLELFKKKNSILNFPYFFSTKMFYLFYKIFGLRFALCFV